jgi:TPR repeat protein
MYFSGEGIPQNDAEAVRLYRLAAQQGDASAEQALGLLYFNGLAGITQSYAEAVKWYTLAAEQGLAFAQSELGVLYANGQGVPQD